MTRNNGSDLPSTISAIAAAASAFFAALAALGSHRTARQLRSERQENRLESVSALIGSIAATHPIVQRTGDTAASGHLTSLLGELATAVAASGEKLPACEALAQAQGIPEIEQRVGAARDEITDRLTRR